MWLAVSMLLLHVGSVPYMLLHSTAHRTTHLLIHLSLQDLKRFLLVCKDLASVGSRDRLWRDVGLSRQEVEEELAMIKMDRPSRMKKIYIKDYVDDSLGNDEAQTRTIVRNVLQYSCAIEHVRELSNLVNIGLC